MNDNDTSENIVLRLFCCLRDYLYRAIVARVSLHLLPPPSLLMGRTLLVVDLR